MTFDLAFALGNLEKGLTRPLTRSSIQTRALPIVVSNVSRVSKLMARLGDGA